MMMMMMMHPLSACALASTQFTSGFALYVKGRLPIGLGNVGFSL